MRDIGMRQQRLDYAGRPAAARRRPVHWHDITVNRMPPVAEALGSGAGSKCQRSQGARLIQPVCRRRWPTQVERSYRRRVQIQRQPEIIVPTLGESVSCRYGRALDQKSGRFRYGAGDCRVVEFETDKVTLESAVTGRWALGRYCGRRRGWHGRGWDICWPAWPRRMLAHRLKGLAPKRLNWLLLDPLLSLRRWPNPLPKIWPEPTDTQKLSPAVRRLVDENNLDPATIAATGVDGQIATSGDVMAAIKALISPYPSAQPPSAPPARG